MEMTIKMPDSRMLKFYDCSCFRFTDNFFRITIPFAAPIEKEMTGIMPEMTLKTGINDGENTPMTEKTSGKMSGMSEKTSEKILVLLELDPFMTIAGMSGKYWNLAEQRNANRKGRGYGG
jgi:hypothetical protein